MRRWYIYPNREADTDWMDRYQTVKAGVCFRGLLPKILGSSSRAKSTEFKLEVG